MPGTTVRIEQIQSAMDGGGDRRRRPAPGRERRARDATGTCRSPGLGFVVIGRSGGAIAARARVRGRGGRRGLARRHPHVPRDPQRRAGDRRRDRAAPRRPRARARRGRRRRSASRAASSRSRPARCSASRTPSGCRRRRCSSRRSQTERLVDVTRAARVDPLGQDRARHRATAAHERDRGLRPERVQGGRGSRRDRDRGARRRRARDHRAGARLQGRPLGARLLHDLLGPRARARAGSTGARARGGSSRATSSCSSSARSPTATGRITRARSCAGTRDPGSCRRPTTRCAPPRAPVSRPRSPARRGGDVDRASRAVCAAAGFTQFPHHTGHGTGFRYHESRPQLVPGGTDVAAGGQRDHHRAGHLLARARRRRPPRGQRRRHAPRAPWCLRRPTTRSTYPDGHRVL